MPGQFRANVVQMLRKFRVNSGQIPCKSRTNSAQHPNPVQIPRKFRANPAPIPDKFREFREKILARSARAPSGLRPHPGSVRAPPGLRPGSVRAPSGLRPGSVRAPSGLHLGSAGRAGPGWARAKIMDFGGCRRLRFGAFLVHFGEPFGDHFGDPFGDPPEAARRAYGPDLANVTGGGVGGGAGGGVAKPRLTSACAQSILGFLTQAVDSRMLD
jgi:hypothetical protein